MSEYFNDIEFECKCGCGINNVNKNLRNKANKAREFAGIPFHLTSACRCEKHNKDIGGKKNSSHITTEEKECTAIDVSAKDSRSRFLIINGMLKAGFNRIGVAKTFIHGDVDISKDENVIWVY